jgi:hypothetical protein
MTDDELIERLNAEKFSGRYAMGGATVDANGKGTSWGGERIMERVNPDGPAAATRLVELLKERDDRVERLEAERDALSFELKQCSATMGRLQGLLVRYGDKVRMGTAARMEDQQVIDEAFQARAALTEKHNG